jgi:hypothetical protein
VESGSINQILFSNYTITIFSAILLKHCNPSPPFLSPEIIEMVG